MDEFPLPYRDGVLDAVAGYEVYNFLDGFNGYNQIRMHLADQEKTTFIEWGGSGSGSGHDVWTQNITDRISKNCKGNIRRVHPDVHASISK